MAEIGDPRFYQWYTKQLRLHPGGLIPLALAARVCGCSRQAIFGAAAAGKLRVARYLTFKPRVVLVDLDDLITWQASRFQLISGSRGWYRVLGNHPRKREAALALRGEPLCISEWDLRERRERAEKHRHPERLD